MYFHTLALLFLIQNMMALDSEHHGTMESMPMMTTGMMNSSTNYDYFLNHWGIGSSGHVTKMSMTPPFISLRSISSTSSPSTSTISSTASAVAAVSGAGKVGMRGIMGSWIRITGLSVLILLGRMNDYIWRETSGINLWRLKFFIFNISPVCKVPIFSSCVYLPQDLQKSMYEVNCVERKLKKVAAGDYL